MAPLGQKDGEVIYKISESVSCTCHMFLLVLLAAVKTLSVCLFKPMSRVYYFVVRTCGINCRCTHVCNACVGVVVSRVFFHFGIFSGVSE